MIDTPILGIDPGISGAIAFYDPSDPSSILADDLPVVAKEIDASALARRLEELRPAMAVIERVNAMPKQGVASTFKFGAAYGAVRAVVQAAGIPTHLVAPTVWKRHYRLDSDKEKARALAIRLWPQSRSFERKKDHGRPKRRCWHGSAQRRFHMWERRRNAKHQ